MEKEKAETAPKSDSPWSLKAIFAKKSNGVGDAQADAVISPEKNPPLSFLSPLANSVVSSCSK